MFAVLQIGVIHAAQCIPSGANFSVLNVAWGNSTHPVSAGPGEMDVPLTVSLEAYGTNCNLYDVEGQLQVYGGFSNFSTGQKHIPPITYNKYLPRQYSTWYSM